MIRTVDFYLLESTALAAAITLFAFSLRKHSAATRHAILLVAAGKFAFPAALFSILGAGIGSLFPLEPLRSAVPRQLAALMPAQNIVPDGGASHSSWWVLVAALWIGGAAVALARWSRSILAPIESSASALTAETELLARAQRRIGYQGLVVLRVSNSQTEPTLSGILRPTLIIPSFLSKRLTAPELESVFLHELAHAKRRDNLSAAFVHTLVCLLWFHPLVRWLERRLLHERELACDEAVMACGVSPKTYTAAILKVCDFPLSPAVAGISGVTSSHVHTRMEAIMSWSNESFFRPAPKPLLAVLIAVVTIAPLSLGILTAALHGQAKVNATTPGNSQPSSTSCTFADKRYPEGTVIQEGTGPEQMCIGVLAPLEQANPRPKRAPQWIRTNQSIRERTANVIHLPVPPPFSCKPKASNSDRLCSCEGADSGFSPGSVVDSANGALKCDKGNWQPATREESSPDTRRPI